MSFTRLLGYAVLFLVLTVAAGLLFVALLLGIFWLAHKLGHIEGERWEQYFQSVSTAGLLLRVGAVMAVALAAVAALSVPLFARLGFQEPGLLAALFFVARGAYLLNKFSRRRDELIQKLLKLKRGASSAGGSGSGQTCTTCRNLPVFAGRIFSRGAYYADCREMLS